MNVKNSSRLVLVALVVGGSALAGCGSDQKRAPSAEEVANGDALPVAPPVPAQPASTDSPATAPAPVVNAAASSPSASSVGGTGATSSPDEETLTEAQVARFAELANTAEVEQGKVALTKAKAPAVKKFADMMVKHHTEALQEQTKLIKKLNVVPAESASATALKADGDKTLKTLQDASAADFDRTYVASQVDAHEKVLQALDKKLIPAVRTPELVTGLRKMRATVEAHLSQAKTLQAQASK